jgi:hypothetical protein
MSNGSSGSKNGKTTPARDSADIDQSLGYVSVHEIRSLVTYRMRQLDAELWPRVGKTPQREEIIDFFSTFGVELMQKAQRNYEQFCKRHPTPTQKPIVTPDAEAAERYRARQEKMESYRK